MLDEHVVNKYIIIISVLCSFVAAFTSSAVSVALPTIAVDLNVTNIMQNWLVNIYLLVIAAVSVPFGKLCSRYGLKKTMKIGIITYFIGTILTGMSTNGYSMILFRIIQAMGSAFLFLNSTAMITVQIPPHRRGSAMGLSLTGVYAGLTLAPSAGGVLVEYFHWRVIFYIMIPLIIIAYILLGRIDKEWINNPNEQLDIKGSVLFSTGIVLLIYGFTILNQLNGLILVLAGLLILVVFARHELTVSSPVYNMHLFKNKIYAASNIASLISFSATFVIIYIINYHLQYLNGFSPQTTGLILIVNPVIMVVSAPIVGRLSDMIKPQILTTAGMIIVSTAVFILSLLNEYTPLYMIIMAMILEGIGLGLFSTPNNSIIMGSVERKYVSTASASVSTVRTIGESLSLGLLTLIFEFVMGNVAIVPENYALLVKSSQITMMISLVMCIIAIFLSLIGIKSEKEN